MNTGDGKKFGTKALITGRYREQATVEAEIRDTAGILGPPQNDSNQKLEHSKTNNNKEEAGSIRLEMRRPSAYDNDDDDDDD